MRWGSLIRRHLGWKLLLSYLIVIVVGAAVLIMAAEFAAPVAFERHLAAMAQRMAHDTSLADDLFANFRRAVTESFALGGLAATATAVGLSIFVSRRVMTPVGEMMRASLRIADGHYDERVTVFGGAASLDELDELGRLAQSFNRMAETLEETEARRRDLIGNVAHELRTPLSSIKGYMEGLIDGVLPADVTTFEKVYHEADRLQRLVHDLQELSRVEARAVPLRMRSLAVPTLVQAVFERVGQQYEEKGVLLEWDLPGALPLVRGDEDRLIQVLLNLVGNALQYTPSGGRVRVRAQGEGRLVRVSVEDTGVGIAARHLPHLFDRFYRVDGSRSRAGGGSGIGLTIARHLVEAHGGRISAASDGPGKGSTFAFTIPVA